MTTVPVLEVGGSHVTAALVDLAATEVVADTRLPLEPDADTDTLLAVFADAGHAVTADIHPAWGVAIPGPFDYERGIGQYEHVAKFESLTGVDVGAALRKSLPTHTVRFLNDADAFGLGEWAVGAARGARKAAFFTLGTGIGSCFLDDGVPIHDRDDVPPTGHVHVLRYGDDFIEEALSRRALRRAYTKRTGKDLDVAEIAQAIRDGDADARTVWEDGFAAMATTIGPWVARFGAEVVVVGGSIAKSWDLVEPAMRGRYGDAQVLPAQHPDDAPLFGAARWALN